MSRPRTVTPSGFPQMPIQFYHMGKCCCVSLEKARHMAADLKWAIKQVETELTEEQAARARSLVSMKRRKA